MIIPDVNLLVYAYNRSVEQHSAARRWWEACLSGSEPVGLPLVSLLGFIRLLSHPKVVTSPVPPETLARVAAQWLERPNVRLIGPGPHHFEVLQRLFHDSGAGASLTTDVHLAALALEFGATLCSNDTDFARFSGVKLTNPLLVQ